MAEKKLPPLADGLVRYKVTIIIDILKDNNGLFATGDVPPETFIEAGIEAFEDASLVDEQADGIFLSEYEVMQ